MILAPSFYLAELTRSETAERLGLDNSPLAVRSEAGTDREDSPCMSQ